MPADDDYLWDKRGADPEVARLEELLAPLRHQAPLDELRMKRKRSRAPWIAGALAIAAAAGVVIVIWPEPDACQGGSGFAFTAKGGDVSCEGSKVAAGVLPIDGVLDTGDHEADLAIATIGKAELGSNTRVHLDRTDAKGHRLTLDRGHLHAKVDAPPRLFEVGTPAGNVTDLGCEYTLDVDAAGAGAVHVDYGKVELAAGSTLVVAPALTHAKIFPGRRPGLPVMDGSTLDADADAVQAGVPGAIDALLAHATARDAITVANLASITEPGRRRPILERLAVLWPPPDGLTVDDCEDPKMFESLWLEDIVAHLYKGGRRKK